MIRVQAKAVNGESWQPKTRVNRAVPVSRALRAYLDRYTPRPSFGDWHFPSPTGRRYDVDNFSQGGLAALRVDVLRRWRGSACRSARASSALTWTCGSSTTAP